MNRVKILNRLDKLDETECIVCPYRSKPTSQCNACPTYKEIGTLGDALLENPRRPKKIQSRLDKGSGMDDEDILILLELGVKKSVIRKALGISHKEFAVVWRSVRESCYSN